MPAKFADEAGQVARGGIVLVCTSELSLGLTQAQGTGEGFLGDLVERVLAVGAQAANVSAFAVLDESGAGTLDPFPAAPLPATLIQDLKPGMRQVLLWVPNTCAEVQPQDSWRAWFEPPF